jgi:hypothetical protein
MPNALCSGKRSRKRLVNSCVRTDSEMKICTLFVLTIAMSLSVACAATPTPVPSPTLPSTSLQCSLQDFSPPSTPSLAPERTIPPLPLPIDGHYAPPDVPTCIGAVSLGQPFKLPWDKWDQAKLERVIAHAIESNWTYYQCAQPASEAVAFYRQWMRAPEYNWFEDSVEERAEGTLAIYNNSTTSSTGGYRWVYLIFLPDKSDTRISNLAVTWWNAPYSC